MYKVDLSGALEVLQRAHSEEVIERRLNSQLQRIMVQEESLARDLALFGDTHQQEILEAYGISAEKMLELLEDEAFTQRMREIRELISRDPKGRIRARAEMYLDSGLDSAYAISTDPNAKPSDRIKAIQFLALMADAVPKNSGLTVGGDPVQAGMNVVFNFGERHPQQRDLTAITVKKSEG